MSKLLPSLAALLLLGGCAGAFVPVRTQYQVVKPDESMYKCDVVPLPDPDSLTNAQVAELINDLYANNKICKNNIEAIRKFYDTAKAIVK